MTAVTVETSAEASSQETAHPGLTVGDVSFAYPGTDRAALENINMTLGAGDIAALVGPSGCGKTTLLKTIGGVLAPTSGTISFGSEDVTHLPVSRRRVGWVPQQYALFEHLDVKSNIAFGLRAQKVPKAQRLERVQEMLKLCRITELADRAPDELSGGQRQRVAIARALAPNPKVLLLDEPLGALDPQLRGQLRADLRKMIRKAGVTTVIVTHDQEEALAMADHLVMMNSGRIEQSGKPESVWAHPNSAWAAEFLGHATILPVVEYTDSQRAVIKPGLSVPVKFDDGQGEAADGTMGLAIRSVDFEAVPVEGESKEAGLPAESVPTGTSNAGGVIGVVREVEYRGDGFVVKAELEDGLRVPAEARVRMEIGQRTLIRASERRNVPQVEK